VLCGVTDVGSGNPVTAGSAHDFGAISAPPDISPPEAGTVVLLRGVFETWRTSWRTIWFHYRAGASTTLVTASRLLLSILRPLRVLAYREAHWKLLALPVLTVPAEQRSPVRMSDRSFKDASEAAKILARIHRHPPQLVEGLRGLPGLAQLIRSLPSLVVPADEINEPIAAHLRGLRGIPGMRQRRFCQAVLSLGATQQRYLAGRSRQALRTNLSRARDLGITCAPVKSDDDKRALIEAMSTELDKFSIRTEDLFRFPDDVWMAARSREGQQIAMALLSHSSSYGLLNLLVARKDDSASSQVVWALHSAVVQELRAMGGKYLFVQGRGSLLLKPGLQYFQHLNGYQLMNVRLDGATGAMIRTCE
jgi:hypothetical protein